MKNRNKIGHVKTGTSDKVYIVSIVAHDDGTFSCIGRYGRNQGNIKEDIKCSRVTEWQANNEADELVHKKFNKSRQPYVDIDSPEYRHNLTRRNSWLSRWLEDEKSLIPSNTKPATPKATPKKVEPEPAPVPVADPVGVSDELICINNAGYEHLFDQGIEYISEGVSGDFVIVIDKFGDKQEVFKERFATEREAEKLGVLRHAMAV